ncbi:molecular chaperone [Pseudomonas alkylphenolica]|uniref:fimbrial biogenesis chaperone n=1 Tax=Pseudomonas alkylphenolica TaxID=237609 RepID=UPI0018D9AAFE|nr:molecular chaperone [Pseudomonas alkylphenolica]MBH3430261.1 molecular chaperone [Pseudomonas alkylphenolica]
MLPFSRSLTTLCSCLALLTASLPSAHAALTISHTRIVHESAKRSASVIVANPASKPYAAQAWVNTEADDATTAVPLIASPSLFRLDPGGEQTVQINALPNDLPQDRESLFYFNVQEIPQATADTGQNVLNIALRTRIKLFYRPSQLKGRPQDRLKDLAWSIQQIEGKTHLVVDNPSPYHFTFNRLVISGAGISETINAKGMALPLGRQAYALQTVPVTDGLQVTFTTINDYSGITAEISSPVAQP